MPNARVTSLEARSGASGRAAMQRAETSVAPEPVEAVPEIPAETEQKVPPKRKGGVVRKYRGQTTREQEAQIDAVDNVFSAIGRTVVFEDTIDEIDGHLIAAAPNAYFNPRTNEYHIALDGIGQAYMYFAVHESVHDIAANSRLGYERLEEIVFDTLRAQGEDIDALVAVQKKIHPVQDEAYWREEVVANTVPVILDDRQTGKEFRCDSQTRTKPRATSLRRYSMPSGPFCKKRTTSCGRKKAGGRWKASSPIWTRWRTSARLISPRWRKRLGRKRGLARRGMPAGMKVVLRIAMIPL